MGLKKRLADLTGGADIPEIYNPNNLQYKDASLDPPYIIPRKFELGNVSENLIRGGVSTAVRRRLEDTERIGKFLITPKGLNFIAKQVGLQASNPKISAPHTKFELSQLLNPPSSNQRTYNFGINTLASIAAGSVTSGLFLKREGIIPSSYEGYVDDVKSISELSARGNSPKQQNRLVFLYNNKLLVDLDGESKSMSESLFGEGKFSQFIDNSLDIIGGRKNIAELYSYAGGPSSLYGIGRTTIGRYTNTNPMGLTIYPFDDDDSGETQKTTSFKSNFLNREIFRTPAGATQGTFNPSDGRVGTNYDAPIKGGGTYHREKRINLGNPGVGINPSDGTRIDTHTRQTKNGKHLLNVYDGGRIDKINMMDIVRVTNGNHQKPEFRDLIRFRFEAIDTDSPSFRASDSIIFRAFLDSVDDSFDATYNTFKYNGRGEEFYTYDSFKRNINVKFKVAAQTRWEMMPIYRKLNFLVSNTAPDYGSNGRMRTPFIRLTVGQWMNRIPGVISSVNLTWQKDYPWEINLDGPENATSGGSHMMVLPHVLDVSVTFKPVHNFLPQKSIQSPFILPSHEDKDFKLTENQKWLKVGSYKLDDTTRKAPGKVGINKLTKDSLDINEREKSYPEYAPPTPLVFNSNDDVITKNDQ